MHGRSRAHRWTTAIGVVAVALATTPSDASTTRPDVPREITGTVEGRAFAREATDRITDRYGIELAADALAVWSFGDRRIAGPRGATIVMQERIHDDGSIGHVYAVTEAPAEAVAGTFVPAATVGTASSGWQLVGSSCWIDDRDQGSWMDVCYHKYRATSDGSARYDYYALNMFSTFAAPQFGLEVGDPWIEARPAKGAPHTWHDWDPREDTTLPCSTTISLEVVVRGFPLEISASQCATWDITKSATAGQFRNKWTEGLCMMRQGETALEFEIASRVPQNKVPTWTFHWYEEADLAACTF